MNHSYNKNSPYAKTSLDPSGGYLDMYVSRPVPASASDQSYVIDNKYDLRPDLLAADLYGNSALWWVFAERNPNALTDPVGSFRAGVTIYVPDTNALLSALGG
jgi:hypothetical protein